MGAIGEAGVAAFHRVANAIAGNDAAGVRAVLAPDAVIWHNTSQVEEGPESVLAAMAGMHATFAGVAYDIASVLPTPEGAVARFVLRLTGADGDELAMAAAMFVTVDESGVVTRVEEYLDSAQSPRARAGF